MRKKAALFFISLLSIFPVHAQRLDTLSSDAKQQYLGYMKNHSTYKTTGWVLLGTGAALFGTAYRMNVANGWNGPTKGESLVIAGIATAAISPLFFIVAGVHKRKERLALKGERLTSAIIFHRSTYAALSLSIIL
jgi:hypothetical protein